MLDVLPVTFADGRLMAAMDDLTVLGYAAASTFRGVVEALHPEPDRERAALLASMARVLGGDTTTVVRPLSLDEMGTGGPRTGCATLSRILTVLLQALPRSQSAWWSSDSSSAHMSCADATRVPPQMTGLPSTRSEPPMRWCG